MRVSSHPAPRELNASKIYMELVNNIGHYMEVFVLFVLVNPCVFSINLSIFFYFYITIYSIDIRDFERILFFLREFSIMQFCWNVLRILEFFYYE